MSISSVTAVTPIRPPVPTPASAQPADTPSSLAPAVRIDIRKPDSAGDANPEKTKADVPLEEAVDRRNSIDPDTKTLVYQVVDQASGDVVVQIPDAVVLKTRAYVEAQAARNQKSERPLDLTA